ncbi:uncharacterized membrane protein At4g09580-like [Pistacia vera]|uniref:uncharacterized membrane protein At4g09580-like n=1 Tax=Pistacia vera TaxID=55513 RepID=UPI001262F24B|nr:uncharacterized membrane protein At4g09580-like [Pistacia vera]
MDTGERGLFIVGFAGDGSNYCNQNSNFELLPPKRHSEILTEFSACPAKYHLLQYLFCRDHLENCTSDYTVHLLVGYCVVYIFMQTFMIPGTVFMSLLAGSLFGVIKGVALVVFTATAGASSFYFLSKLIGRPRVFTLWPDKLVFFQDQVAIRGESLLNCFLFLRLTPTLPNTFINVASPIVDVPLQKLSDL